MSKMSEPEVYAARSLAIREARSKQWMRDRTMIDRWVLKLAGSSWFPKERAELDDAITGAIIQVRMDREAIALFTREEQWIRRTSNPTFRSGTLITAREDVKANQEHLMDLQFVKSLFPLPNDTP